MIISEDELLLYDVNTSKNPDVPYESYGKFDLNDMDDSQCISEFCFHKSDFLVLPEALHLPNYFTIVKKEQYAMEDLTMK